MLCLAEIESAFEINNVQRDRAACYMYEIQPSRSFGDGQEGRAATRKPTTD